MFLQNLGLFMRTPTAGGGSQVNFNNKNPQAGSIFSSGTKNVYIVDDFHNKDIDLDGDDKGDMTHGEFVEKVMKLRNPSLNVKKIAMPANEEDWSARALNKRLGQINAKILAGEKVDAVNLSMEQSVTFSQLKRDTGIPLNQRSIHLYAGRVRTWLKSNRPDVYSNIIAIESLTAKNINVYIAGGSKGDDFFNFLTLAEGSVDVAGLDESGRLGEYSADNSLIDRKERGTYTIRHKGNGLDINGDNKPDYFPNKNFGFGSGRVVGQVGGSSFAAPAALAIDMA